MKEFKQGSPRATDCGQRIQMGDWLPKDSPDGVGRPFGAVWSVIPTGRRVGWPLQLEEETRL